MIWTVVLYFVEKFIHGLSGCKTNDMDTHCVGHALKAYLYGGGAC